MKFVCDGCGRSRQQKEGGALSYTRVENRKGTWARYAQHLRLCDRCIDSLITYYATTRKEGSHTTEG